MDCIFCKIVEGTIPSDKVYEDDRVLAFHDVAPQSPVHVLVIPKRHIVSLAALSEADDALLAHLFAVIRRIAAEQGIADSGYRVVTNVGEDGGQSVKHLHFHILGGRALKWDN